MPTDPDPGPDASAFRLRPPRPTRPAPPTPDPDQQAVLDLTPGHGPVLVLGVPGAGRSTLVVEYAARRILAGTDPERVLVLAPSRQQSAHLRDELSERLQSAGRGTRATTPVRTWASYAFDLIRRARAEGYLPQVQRTPRLLAGAEQDTIIAELLSSYAAGDRPGPDWPEDLSEAVRTRGFRQEVRELIDRTSEYGIEPGTLQDLGETHGRCSWVAAATLLQDYRDRLDLGMNEAFDPAGLLATAAELLESNPELLDAERSRIPVIVVDDLQEATAAVHRLLRLIAADQDAVVTASPDTTVQGFRGARPERVADYPQALVSGDGEGLTLSLSTTHRLSEQILTAWRRGARRLPATPQVARIRQDAVPAAGDAAPATAAVPAASSPAGSGTPRGVEAHVVASPSHERQLILQRLLELHHRGRIPLDRLAVIVRSGGMVAEITRYLESEGIPVHRAVADTVLKGEPAVLPLLEMLRLVTGAQELDIDTALWLLAGRYGGSTALHVRQLRQRLLRRERQDGGRRTSAELLLAVLHEPELLEDPALTVPGAGARRIAAMLRAGRCAAEEPGATAETVLWALWDATATPRHWESLALSGQGQDSRRADRDLDAVVALFGMAERYVDQFPGASVASYAEYMEAQDLPMDTLASQSSDLGVVSVLAPGTAAGQEWDAVIVPGLQDGMWPNIRLRGQLLGATDLAEILAGRASAASHRTRVAEVRQDELRSFSTAVSRARHTVIGIAVASEDQQPSEFLDLLEPWRQVESDRPLTPVPTPITGSALVAQLRRTLEEADTEASATTAAAATGLAALARGGVRGADPESWWGLLPLSTHAPLVDTATTPVPVSPSRVETALKSPLNWFLYQAGAQAGTTQAQTLGTLIHLVGEIYARRRELPDATPAGPAEDAPASDPRQELRQILHQLLPNLGLEPGWETDRVHARAETMVEALAQYLGLMDREGRRVLAVEQHVRQDLERDGLQVLINGVIDRLEEDVDGRPFVVDLKTGGHAPTNDEMEQLPQLAVYQVAVAAGALEHPGLLGDPTHPAGAALVQLGAGTKSVKVQRQSGLEPESQWAQEQVFTAARRMVGPGFLAFHGGPDEPRCALPEACPICSEGRQSTERTR